MRLEKELHARSGSKCELCNSTENLSAFEVPDAPGSSADHHVLVCKTCREQIDDPEKIDVNHWRCLNDSMWSEVPGTQVVAWRMLNRMRAESWPQDLLDMLYLDDDKLAWAKKGQETEDAIKHVDSNGAELKAGDTVVLVKDLKVKGGGFTAKRGTAVRRITLVADNPEHIEGRVNDQRIVILTKYVKKS